MKGGMVWRGVVEEHSKRRQRRGCDGRKEIFFSKTVSRDFSPAHGRSPERKWWRTNTIDSKSDENDLGRPWCAALLA